jgi:hypothetical protein
LLQPLQERRITGLVFRITRGEVRQHSDTPHAFALLGVRGERPCYGCATKRGNELPSADADCHLIRPLWGHARCTI